MLKYDPGVLCTQRLGSLDICLLLDLESHRSDCHHGACPEKEHHCSNQHIDARLENSGYHYEYRQNWNRIHNLIDELHYRIYGTSKVCRDDTIHDSDQHRDSRSQKPNYQRPFESSHETGKDIAL